MSERLTRAEFGTEHEEVSRADAQHAGNTIMSVISAEMDIPENTATSIDENIDSTATVTTDTNNTAMSTSMEQTPAATDEKRIAIKQRGEDLDKLYGATVEKYGEELVHTAVEFYLKVGICKMTPEQYGPDTNKLAGGTSANGTRDMREQSEFQKMVHELTAQETDALIKKAVEKIVFEEPFVKKYKYEEYGTWKHWTDLSLESAETRKYLSKDKLQQLGIDPEDEAVRKKSYENFAKTCDYGDGWASRQAEWYYQTFGYGEHLDELMYTSTAGETEAVYNFLDFQPAYNDSLQKLGLTLKSQTLALERAKSLRKLNHDYRAEADLDDCLKSGDDWFDTERDISSVRKHQAVYRMMEDCFDEGEEEAYEPLAVGRGYFTSKPFTKQELAECGIDVSSEPNRRAMLYILQKTLEFDYVGYKEEEEQAYKNNDSILYYEDNDFRLISEQEREAQVQWIAETFDLKDEAEMAKRKMAEKIASETEHKRRSQTFDDAIAKMDEGYDFTTEIEKKKLDKAILKVPAEIYNKALSMDSLSQLRMDFRQHHFDSSRLDEAESLSWRKYATALESNIIKKGLGEDEAFAIRREMLGMMLAQGVNESSGEPITNFDDDSDWKVIEQFVDLSEDSVRRGSYSGFANVLRSVNGEKSVSAKAYFEKLGYGEHMSDFLSSMASIKEGLDITKRRGFQTKLNRFLRGRDEYTGYLDKLKQDMKGNEKADYGRLGAIQVVKASDFHDSINDLINKAQEDGDYFHDASEMSGDAKDERLSSSKRYNRITNYGLMKVAYLDKLGKYLEQNVDQGTQYFCESFDQDGTGSGGRSSYFAVQFNANGRSFLLAESLKDEAAMYFASGEENEDLREVFRANSRMDARKDTRVGYIMHLDREHANDSIQDAFMQAFFHMFVDKNKTAWRAQRNSEDAQMIPNFKQMEQNTTAVRSEDNASPLSQDEIDAMLRS